MSRASGELPSTSQSSSSSGTRPTWIRRTAARTASPPISTSTVTGRPSGPGWSASGRSPQSVAGYRSRWPPSGPSDWRKYPLRYSRPTPTSGTPRSEADFRWSPARMPRPPE